MENKLSPEIQNLLDGLKNSPEVQKMRNNVGYLHKPMFKRVLVKMIPWSQNVKTASGLIIASHEATKEEKDRKEDTATNHLRRAVVVEAADDCRPEIAPGVVITMMSQEALGYSTRMRIPSVNAIDGVHDYYIINEHEALTVLVDTRIIEDIEENSGKGNTLVIEPSGPGTIFDLNQSKDPRKGI
jgi:hypothetical protein